MRISLSLMERLGSLIPPLNCAGWQNDPRGGGRAAAAAPLLPDQGEQPEAEPPLDLGLLALAPVPLHQVPAGHRGLPLPLPQVQWGVELSTKAHSEPGESKPLLGAALTIFTKTKPLTGYMIFADKCPNFIYLCTWLCFNANFQLLKCPRNCETLQNFVDSSVSSLRVRTMLTKFPTGPIPSHWYRPHRLSVHTVHS